MPWLTAVRAVAVPGQSTRARPSFNTGVTWSQRAIPRAWGFVRDVPTEAWTQQSLGELVQVQAAGAGQKEAAPLTGHTEAV